MVVLLPIIIKSSSDSQNSSGMLILKLCILTRGRLCTSAYLNLQFISSISFSLSSALCTTSTSRLTSSHFTITLFLSLRYLKERYLVSLAQLPGLPSSDKWMVRWQSVMGRRIRLGKQLFSQFQQMGMVKWSRTSDTFLFTLMKFFQLMGCDSVTSMQKWRESNPRQNLNFLSGSHSSIVTAFSTSSPTFLISQPFSLPRHSWWMRQLRSSLMQQVAKGAPFSTKRRQSGQKGLKCWKEQGQGMLTSRLEMISVNQEQTRSWC